MEIEDDTIWVVVRLDLYLGDLDPSEPGRTITLREAMPSMDEAVAEAARLNALRDDGGVVYFSSPVRWYPDGRNVTIGY